MLESYVKKNEKTFREALQTEDVQGSLTDRRRSGKPYRQKTFREALQTEDVQGSLTDRRRSGKPYRQKRVILQAVTGRRDECFRL